MLDLDQLLPEACHLIAETFGYDVVGINLRDPLNDGLLFQAAAYPASLTLPRSFRVPVGRGITGWVVEHGTSRLVNDVSREPLYVRGPGRHSRSELDVPLQVGGRTIGVLNVKSERPDAFAPDDVPYLEGLAAQLAQAIDNARLAAQARDMAAVEERSRIARDLHDETVQALVAISRQLDLLELELDDPASLSSRLGGLHELVNRTLEGVRRLSRNLRPAVLEDLGLVPAIEAHLTDLAHAGLTVRLAVIGQPRRLAAAIEDAAFRVAQEALSNVLRHAGVDQAELAIRFDESTLELIVRDSGSGTARTSRLRKGDGQGLIGMRDRAAAIGGELRIESSPEQGTEVRLTVPLTHTLLERA
jgi:signal transduction histidine kinase